MECIEFERQRKQFNVFNKNQDIYLVRIRAWCKMKLLLSFFFNFAQEEGNLWSGKIIIERICKKVNRIPRKGKPHGGDSQLNLYYIYDYLFKTVFHTSNQSFPLFFSLSSYLVLLSSSHPCTHIFYDTLTLFEKANWSHPLASALSQS